MKVLQYEEIQIVNGGIVVDLLTVAVMEVVPHLIDGVMYACFSFLPDGGFICVEAGGDLLNFLLANVTTI